MESKLIEKAKEFAFKAHSDTNHYYGDEKLPYSVHLQKTFDVAKEYIDFYFTEEEQENILCACYLHDTIEDTRTTYHTIKSEFNKEIAEIVFALTNDKGRNRKERAGEKYYKGIRECYGADFVKLCDRYANIQFSFENKNVDKLEMYKKEHAKFLYQMNLCVVQHIVLPNKLTEYEEMILELNEKYL